MIIKQIRISNDAKNKLSRLKGKTGIQNWNILCRWALCLSLSHPSIPSNINIPADSNVEMSWQVFGGEYQEIYEALVKQRCIDDGLGTDPETLAKYFKLHLNRGIAYLSGTKMIRSCEDLVRLAFAKNDLK
ncbi:MAG: DNA sulfur modification protein DndE [Fastidiosipilaceae bacterium]|jgi:DNA sulfur modification protein DndE